MTLNYISWFGSRSVDLGVRITTSLPLLRGPLRPGVVVPFKVSSMGQIYV